MQLPEVTDPWAVRDADFPAGAPPEDRLRFLLQYAILAPSAHNTQPWFFRLHGDSVDLYADRTRALPVVDPTDRELTISCGAALGHLQTAARRFGYTDEVTLLPDPSTPDLLARVRLGTPRAADPEELALFAAVANRRTNRHRFEDRLLPAALGEELTAHARAGGVHLAIVDDAGVKTSIVGLVMRGDRTQMADPRFRRELASWMHPQRSATHDGLSAYELGRASLGLDPMMTRVSSLVVRTFDMGNSQAAVDRQLVEHSPVLAIFWTDGDTPRDWLQTGQALSRVLLKATAAGVSASFLNQPVEVEELRVELARLVSATWPQLLLRLGYGPHIEPSARRPLTEVVRAG
ncbi:MAG TPA: nitroreductase [bacterium]|nr:nitroreductase [bacterium]